jgi:hypothetical protein
LPGDLVDEAQTLVHLTQQQTSTVATDGTAAELGLDFPTLTP